MESDSLSAQARARYEFREELPAERGRIYDRNGELLARDQTVFALMVDCLHLRDPLHAAIGLAKDEGSSPHAVRRRYLHEELLSRYQDYVAESMSAILQVPTPELVQTLRQRESGEIVLKKGVEDDFAREIQEVIDSKRLKGLYLKRGDRRYYPSPLALTQVIGFVDEAGEGVSGIEKTFNEVMKGRDGYRYCERDNRRREIHAYRGLQVDPVSGKSVFLSVDMALQAVVEREMDAVIDLYRPER
ncbi:MAG: hypothetical protein AAGC68_06240, partial [Verrucomicrobiota bacterium]